MGLRDDVRIAVGEERRRAFRAAAHFLGETLAMNEHGWPDGALLLELQVTTEKGEGWEEKPIGTLRTVVQ